MMPLRSDQPSVGTVLRLRREELGWQIGDVAQWLKIRPKLLVALEADDLRALPGVAYAVGFLRTYATAMDLDADALVARFRRESRGQASPKTELVFPQPEGDRGVPVGLLVGVGLAVVVVAYVGWYRFTAHDIPATRHAPPVAELMPGAATPATTSPQVASVMPGRAPSLRPDDVLPASRPTVPQVPSNSEGPVQQEASSVPSPPVAGEVTENEGPPGSSADPVPSEKSDFQDAQAPTTENAPASEPAASLPPAVPAGSVVVRTLAPVWMQVKDKDGHVVLSRLLKAGESWQGDSNAEPFHMSFGNAGGVVLSADGTTSAPLGRAGEVRRNVEVTEDAIRTGVFGRGVALPVQPSAPTPTDISPDASPSEAESSGGEPPPASFVPHVTPQPRKAAAPSENVSADDLNARQLEQSSPSH
ncbi:hypothetical protein GMO_12910 [Gluconobacter morbifer G707]|uniref:Cytoskeleton protein RodZ-like C-terminal domain-containing protein n=2 Tax=Gluconobacter TaxID=441 RepID=G6XI81_9PROT|nr:hypothetical protein GMO_12910 [Gluconobacter morbifer G707]